MTNQRRTVMGATEFSIQLLQNMKKELMYGKNTDNENAWAIATVISQLSSYLLDTCETVIQDNALAGKLDLKQSVLEIQSKFNQFVDAMVGHE